MFGHNAKRQQIRQFCEIHMNLERSKGVWDFEPTPLSENLKGVLCPQLVMFAPCYYSSCPGLLIGLTSLGPKSGQSDDFVNLLIS